MVEQKRFAIKIFLGDVEDHPYNNKDIVTQALARTFSMEITQAMNCIHVIYSKGSYEVYSTTDAVKADVYVDEIRKHELIATIVDK